MTELISLTRSCFIALYLIIVLQCTCETRNTDDNDLERDKKYSSSIFYSKLGLKPKVTLLESNPTVPSLAYNKSAVVLSTLPEPPKLKHQKHKKHRRRRKNRRRKQRLRKNRKRKQKSRDKFQLNGRTVQVVSRRNGRRMKKDGWCKTQKMRVRVKEPGCISRYVVNNFCRGQCNSYFVPKVMGPSDLGTKAFKSCSSCKPKASAIISVTLVCPGKTPDFVHKKMLRVFECQCLSEIFQS